MTKTCHLRQTKIKLLDGNEYAFRALPFNRRTVGIIAAFTDGASDAKAKLQAMLEAVEISLGFDLTAEKVAEVIEAGLVPMMGGPEGSEEQRILDEVLGAMIQQAKGAA